LKKFCVLFFIIFTGSIFSQQPVSIGGLTVKKVIRNIQDSFDAINTYRAKFDIVVEEGSKKTFMKGSVKYKKPETMILIFDQPEGQIIYSDGRRMRIYIPYLHVVAEQRLTVDSAGEDVILAGTKSSFNQMLKQYNFSFSKEEIKTSGGRKYYVLRLVQKNVYSGFKTIELWISEKWFIIKAKGTTREGRVVTISFSNIEVNTPINDAEFTFTLPLDSQTVYDPFYKVSTK